MSVNPIPQVAATIKTMAGESPPRLRAASACVACNKKKIRCIYPDGSQQCSNCARNHWACFPRERKRKRRKTATENGGEEQNVSAVEQRDIGAFIPPKRAHWETPYSGWEMGRNNIVADGQPSVASESSVGGTSTAQNNTNQSQTPTAPSAIHKTDGSISYANNTSTPAFGPSQGQESRSYEPSPGNSTFLGRSEYIRGEIPINEDQAKAYPAVASDCLSEDDIQILQLQHAFDMPPRAVREGLIDTFMKRCSPWMPIVEESWLLERGRTQPSILLLQAVFLAASRVSSAPAVAAYASSNEFYRRAKALFWLGYEKNTITVITAVCILHWYNPEGPEHVSINTSGFWNRIGVGLAYQIGLHKEPPPGREAPLRRRLWWTLFARDCLISAGHGRPRAINPEDSEVRPLSSEDFYGSSSNGALFMAYVEVSSLLGELTQCCSRRTLTRQKRAHIENALYRWSRELPEHLRLFCRVAPTEGSSPTKLVLPPYNFEARQLHVPYFIILAILYRPSNPGNVPSAAALLAASFVAGIFEDFLARDEIRSLGPIFTFYLLASGVTLISCYPYPHLWERAEQDLRVIYNSQKELSKRWPSAIGSLNALHTMTDEATKAARPAQRPQPTPLTPDQQACFNGFGTDLCRLGEVMLGPYPHDAAEPGRSPDDQHTRTVSDMMTAGILAELKTPMDGSAPANEFLPLATVLDHNSHAAIGGGDVADVIPEDILYGQYEGIGNWLLRDWDWNSEAPW